MAQSGNTVAIKSFQSFMVNEGLLSKTVEAIKAGEKEARSSGNVQSFEVFYKGFRQNIAIGRIYIVPPSVADKKGQDFPTSLLYGCIVRTWGGEEVSDMVSHKIGDSEWDEYSQADYASIKKQLFQEEDGKDGKYASLIIYAPNWLNKREYQGFQFKTDDNQLANLTRHVVFSSYFDPRVSSAFDAMMTNVETSKFDVTDITPKMNFPALAENPLKEFPLLTKEGSKKKPRLALTFKTAEEVTREVLEPQEMNVFESLDQALRNSLLPSTEEAGEVGEKDFTPPAAEDTVPRVASLEEQAHEEQAHTECDKCEGAGCRYCNNTGVKKGSGEKLKASIETYIGAAGGADVLTEITRKLDAIFQKEKASNPRGFMDAFESRLDLHMATIAKDMNLTMDYDAATNTYKFYDVVGKAYRGKPSPKFEKIQTQASATAVFETPITNVGPGTGAADAGNQRAEGYKNEKDTPKVVINSAPIGIALDETGVPRRAEEERKEKSAASMQDQDSEINALFKKRDQLKAEGKDKIKGGEYDAVLRELQTKTRKRLGSSGTPDEIQKDIEKTWRGQTQGADALKDHNASIDAAKWGGIGKKQASSLWVGKTRKIAQTLDAFTRSYIEAALWSTTDNSDPSGGVPMDQNYCSEDLAPSTMAAVIRDCTAFQEANRELLDNAYNTDGMDVERQGHDFWLTREGHGAGYWDGDYPTTGDGLTEAAKAFGEAGWYVGDDDKIYQMGSENYNPAVKASKKNASKQFNASYVAGLIAGGVHVEAAEARSQKSKSAAQKREEEMARKYGSQRRALGSVPQTEEDIWSETMDDIGPAPEIRLPGESEDNTQSTTGDHEINAPEADADLWSDMPEETKGGQEEAAVEFEEALENDTTKKDEPKPSTGEGGASADSKETKSEKSEWAKNRESKPKDESEPEESESESEEESEEEPKEASAKTAKTAGLVKCDQCNMVAINGVPVHESGCPNDGARWDTETQSWVKQRKCFECGSEVDENDPCCSAEPEYEEPLIDYQYESYADDPTLFYVYHNENGAEVIDEENLTEEEAQTIVERSKGSHMGSIGIDAALSDDEFGVSEKTADTADNPANEDGGDGAIEVKTDADIEKTADTADNPVEMKGGEGAVVDKKDSEKADTSGPEIKNTASVLSVKHAGKVTTPKYVLRIQVPGHYVSDASWDVNSRGQLRGAGKPNDANLAKYMDALNKSLAKGGANEHLGDKWKPTSAAIYHNDGTYKNPLATWKPEAEPMFKVEGAAPTREERIAELKALVRSELISEENGAEPQLDEYGKTKEDIATCGTCGMSWNDALITSRTPAPSGRCPYEYIHPEIVELKKLLTQRKRSAGVSGDIAEAKSEIVSPDTVDKDIKQPTESVEEAGKQATDISGDIAEAKSEIGYDKAEVADEARATDTVNPDHFASPTVDEVIGVGGDGTLDIEDELQRELMTCPECGNEVHTKPAEGVPAQALRVGDCGDVFYMDLESEPHYGSTAMIATKKAEPKAAGAGYGDEEDEERPIDLGSGDLADLVIEDEDAN